MDYTYKTIKQSETGLVLAKRNDGKYVVYEYSAKKAQVYSVVPGDMPKGSGLWFAHNTNEGISYVTNGYSESYARKIFHENLQ
jgi:hypothetical protein